MTFLKDYTEDDALALDDCTYWPIDPEGNCSGRVWANSDKGVDNRTMCEHHHNEETDHLNYLDRILAEAPTY